MEKESKRVSRSGLVITNLDLSRPKRSQLTVFIIVAILIVGGLLIYFAVRGGYTAQLPKNMEPVYDYYLSCLDETVREGISLLGEQGGYIEVPAFVPGSQYMPFSSHLDFFGQPVPYWMYVSGNNLLKEQVPTKRMMEKELEDYIEERIVKCDFSDFELQGYDVLIEQGSASVDINDLSVEVDVNNELVIYFEDQSAVVTRHEVSVSSKLGRFYDLALDVYNYEKKNMFLEKYALDVMRLYAPVTGVEITCSPKIFVKEEIREELISGLSANIGALKLKGDYYELASKEGNYFVTDIGQNVDENVNFIYSSDWPTRVEIYGDEVVEPVGLQEGMGILGFCYVPYHFVYDINFPVLIQFWDNQEMFQFPVAVIIDKNQKREALPTIAGESIEDEVCKYKNQQVRVSTYDSELTPIEARIKFKCLNSLCEIGKTSLQDGSSVLVANMPQCVNGFIVASAEDYADAKYQISTNEENSANIIMNRLYEISLDLGDVDKALVRFTSDEHSASVLYPDMRSIKLSEGYYDVSVYVYKNSSLVIPAIHKRECVDVPQEGLGGFFGLEKEKCFDIDIPETNVEFAVVGGGRTQEYLTDRQLRDAVELNINVPLFGAPVSLEELQENHRRAEDEFIYLEFE